VGAIAEAATGKTETGASGRAGTRLVFMACFASLVALLGPTVTKAFAAPTATPAYAYLTAFGSHQTELEPGEFTETARNPLAVDSHGNIFVANLSSEIGIFSPDVTHGGIYRQSITLPVAFNGSDVAIDPTNDDLYVEDNGAVFNPPRVIRYLSDGQPDPTYTLDPSFEVPGGTGVLFYERTGAGIAVDPTTHDLLVADREVGVIERYSQSGTLLGSIPTPGMSPEWIAVAADGSLIVAQRGNPTVLHLSAAGSLLNEFSVGEIRGLTFDPTTGVVAIGAEVGGSFALRSYSLSGDLLSESPVPPAATSERLGIDPNSGRLYSAKHGCGNNCGSTFPPTLFAFVPATTPGVEIPVVTNVVPHGAHFSAEVEPGTDPGGNPGDPAATESSVSFEYSVDGGKTWSSTSAQPLTNAGLQTVEAQVNDLLINSEYIVRLRAANLLAVHAGGTASFHTPASAPEVRTGDVSDLTETTAVLSGMINPARLPTTYHFEYGVSTAYGLRTPTNDSAAGSGRVDRWFSRRISGLQPGTTYHFRLVATNTLGVTVGADRTFTTVGIGGMTLRSYEQVSPVDKKGNPLDVFQGFYAKADGSAFAYASRGGGNGSPFLSFSISHRGPDEWEAPVDLSVPVKGWPGSTTTTTTLAISPDFKHEFVASNVALAPGAAEDGVNFYVVDLATRHFTLVGTFPEGGNGFPFGTFTGLQTADKFQASAPDMSWIVFRSPLPLLPGAPEEALYHWSEEGGLEISSILPNGEPTSVSDSSVGQQPIRKVSTDGSLIYFSSGVGSSSGPLYVRIDGRTTKAVSVSQIPGDPDTPQAAYLKGISANGRYAFLGSLEGKLTEDAPGVPGVPDVYRYDLDDESLEYLGGSECPNSTAYLNSIGVAADGETAYWGSCSDILVWRHGVLKDTGQPFSVTGTSGAYEMSPNGRYLAIEKGGDVADRVGEVDFYDADTGQLTCVSCRADGSHGIGYLPLFQRQTSNYLPRAVTNSGQVFFTSPERLVAADVNGFPDVYVWQNGSPSLISPGNAEFAAIFDDVSEDGSNVFFSTGQKLVGQDDDLTTDHYDARIGGGLASQNPPPAQVCLRDDCKATPGAGPELPFGGSEALSGPGNVKRVAKAKRCRKGTKTKKVKDKTRCVKKQKAKGKAGSKRRQGR
jgi:hypothetical protein